MPNNEVQLILILKLIEFFYFFYLPQRALRFYPRRVVFDYF